MFGFENTLFGIKKNDDIDLWVTNDVFKLMSRDKKLIAKTGGNGDRVYETKDGNVEAGNTLPCTKGRLEDYLKRSILVYGIHFMSMDDVIAWKKCMGRPKDFQHIKLIEKYKKSKVVESYLNVLQHF